MAKFIRMTALDLAGKTVGKSLCERCLCASPRNIHSIILIIPIKN